MMLRPAAAAGDKKESGLSSGFSGKTQAILREAVRKAEGGAAKLPVAFPDGEDKAQVTFYTEGPEAASTWVTHAKSPEAMVVQAQVQAHAPRSGEPLPDLSRVPREAGAVLAAITAHQDAITLDMVQREAGREGVRRQLLEREFAPWRRKQMEETFTKQRTEAHEALKATMASFEAELEAFRRRFAAESAAHERVDAIKARKAEAAAAAARQEEEDY
jgi:hypothetical protein